MRKFERPAVVCVNCQTCLVWLLSFATFAEGHECVTMGDPDPPPAEVPCPKCGTKVDTTAAYAVVPGLPPAFSDVKNAFNGFKPAWEHNRESFESQAHGFIEKHGIASCEAKLNTPEGFAWYRQRMFYRSCVAFHRCFQLCLAFLVLDRKRFRTWAGVTGYYSRFYFIQALLNLLLSTWLELDKVAVVFDGNQVACIEQKNLSKRLKNARSHEVWWALMEALKSPAGYPVDEMGFVLSRLAFNPNDRNRANYSFEYIFGGFPELEWFDSGAKQMLSHFVPVRRADRDFTDIDRFFEGVDPESADLETFYGDTDVQSLWCSITAYLRILKALGFKQSFVKTEVLVALSELHLAGDYSRVRAGITQSLTAILDDDYDASVIEQLHEFWKW